MSVHAPTVGSSFWLVRIESTELVTVSQVTPRTETATVIPHRRGGVPVTAVWEDLHASEADALAHLERRAANIIEYIKSRRDGAPLHPRDSSERQA